MILIDSDVLIAHLRGVPQARDWLRDSRLNSGPLAASVVAIAEVAGGMRSAERRDVARLLDSLQMFPVTEMVAHRAAEFRHRYRRSHSTIGIADYLVAATADAHGLELATLNVKHFPMFGDLRAPFRLSDGRGT